MRKCPNFGPVISARDQRDFTGRLKQLHMTTQMDLKLVSRLESCSGPEALPYAARPMGGLHSTAVRPAIYNANSEAGRSMKHAHG